MALVVHDTSTRDPVRTLDWAARVFRPILISGMIGALTAAMVALVQFFIPDWQAEYLVLFVALASLEMLLAEQRLRARQLYLTSRHQIRLIEIGLMLLLLKPISYLHRGWGALLTDARQWPFDAASFLDRDYALGAIILLVVWLLAIDLASSLRRVEDWHDPQTQAQGLADLKSSFILGAYCLLLAVGLRHVASIFFGSRILTAAASALTLLPLLYVGAGLLLLAQARLALLRTNWAREQIPADPRLGRRWALWGSLFVGGIMLLALLLPAGDTVIGFYVFAWIAFVFGLIGQLLFYIVILLLSLVLALCLALFGIPQNQSVTPPPLSAMPPPLPEAAAGPAWFLYLRVLLFWSVVALILFALLRAYLRDRREFGEFAIRRGLRQWWRTILAWLLNLKKRSVIQFRRPGATPGDKPVSSGPDWWARWRARTTRERVLRLYLALLQRAAQAGHPRLPHQTPLEYAARLQPQLEAEADMKALETLTRAFVQARYSRRGFEREEVSFLHRVWQRLMAALRRR